MQPQGWIAAFLTIVGALVAPRGRATEITPNPEILVSAAGANPALAFSRTGRAMLLWEESGQIRGRRFQGEEPLGKAFRISPEDDRFVHAAPSVAADENSSFVTVWERFQLGASGDDVLALLAQRFRGNGTRRGSLFMPRKAGKGRLLSPLAATALDGRFAIAWEEPAETFEEAHRILVARYGAGGERLGQPVPMPVNEATENALGGLAAIEGSVIVGWTQMGLCAEAQGEEIRAALGRLAWLGPPMTEVVRFTDDFECEGGPVLVGLFAGGSFGPTAVFAGHNFNIARLDPQTGTPTGKRIVIAEAGPCDQESCETIATVAGSSGSDGRFLVVWQRRDTQLGVDAFHLSAQLFGRDGRARSGKVALGSEASATAPRPAAALLENGTVLVAFERSADVATTPGLYLQSLQFSR